MRLTALPRALRTFLFALGALALVQAPSFALLTSVQTEAADEGGWMDMVDGAMGSVNSVLATVIFYDINPWSDEHTQVPLAVAILVLGAIYFTVRMGFLQFRVLGHAIAVTRGKYDDPKDEGEVSHFQALTAALSATVGLGNIGGVAIAVCTGGPGATFWMICAGLLGMASKFTECTLGQMYREVRPDGRVMGGAMFYLSRGLATMGLGGLGKVLAVVFAIMCIGASFGGGNTFQVNQSLDAIIRTVPVLADYRWIYGLVMATLVAIVILGGLKRIAATAEKIVPLMCGIYVASALYILAVNFGEIPHAIREIIGGAFTPRAGLGGALGVLIIGFQRAAFSNEAGIGSAAIAHSAAKTPFAIREGVVALLEPFIDTVIVCTMTALVIVITGTYDADVYMSMHANAPQAADVAAQVSDLAANNNGAALTSLAMSEVLPFFPWVLSLATLMFAFSTMISWSYYGERCWAYLFGDASSVVYRWMFVVFVFLGSIITATNILGFGDLLIFGMVFPNVIGVLLLSGQVRTKLTEYFQKLSAGEFKVFK